MNLQPGIHDGIPAEQYHADPCERASLSASYIHTLLTKSPRHAWITHPQLGGQTLEDKPERFDIGTAAHALLLEGDDIIVEVEAADWRTAAAQDCRKLARKLGKIALLSHQAGQVREMVASIRQQLTDVDADPPFLAAGKPEQTLIWEEHGVTCRARVDWLHDSFLAIDDMKTTGRSANPHEWTRTTLWSIGADVQVAFNRRGVRALTGFTPEFRYFVVECQPPYALAAVSLAPDALALADEKIDKALHIWKDCLDRQEWPAYPRRIAYAELPPWTSARWAEQQALEEMGEEVAA